MTFIASKIRMQSNCFNSTKLLEIKDIYVDGLGWVAKEVLYDYIKYYDYVIKVGNIYGPNLEPALSIYDKKYVKSVPNNSTVDNLFSLPKSW